MKSLSRHSQPYQLYHILGLAVDKVDKVYIPSIPETSEFSDVRHSAKK